MARVAPVAESGCGVSCCAIDASSPSVPRKSHIRMNRSESSAVKPCLFCSMPDQRVIASNDLVYAITDGFPVTDGHSLVIPKRHVADFFGLTDDELMACNHMQPIALGIKIMRLTLLFLILVFIGGASADEPPCTNAEPKTQYVGPMFDAMAQIEAGMSDTVIAAVDESGISRMALFARLHRKRNGESGVLSLKQRFVQRFVMGTPKPFDQGGDLTDHFVEKTLSYLRDKRYQFIGEIMFAHADKSHGEQTATGERYVAPDGKNVIKLLTALEKRNIPVMTHWEVYDWNRDWPGFHALYSRFPGVTFIWPHAGFASAEQVRTVLSSHANVMVTLSKKEKDQRALSSEEKGEMLGDAIVDNCGKLLPEWRDLLEKYPDRFMFATDAHKDFRWARYAQMVKQWRLILGQLPDPIAQALAWGNAEHVYGAPR